MRCKAGKQAPSSLLRYLKKTAPSFVKEKTRMIIFLTIIHVIVCLFLIGVILLQQGKSADLAGAFGGQGSQTAFGPRGAANLLTKLTTWSAIIFMCTSIGLFVLIARQSGPRSVLSGTSTKTPPASTAPATPGKPAK
jgi:preprotein translocase subunit SecG